ncbi:hypothetical protein C8T65DRAFT_745688 [Cerioporus squamosus]|nr:hypothetical protein C8T65DRAFT_745688 [Cerioporus squamosus]
MVPHYCPYESQSDEPRMNPSTQVRAGDVYTVRESVFTPIYDFLRGCLEGDLQAQATAAYHAKLRVQNYKRRPCILMRDYSQSPTAQTTRRMCLSTTLESHPITSLPRIFKDFCIPIYSDTCLSDEHIHALPEWEAKQGWIIAIPFDSSRRLLGQWGAEYAGTPARTRVFGKKAMSYLKKNCVDRREVWLQKCRKNPAYAREHFKECRDHKSPETEKSTDALSVLSGMSKTSTRTHSRAPFRQQTNISMASLAHALHKIRGTNVDKASVRSKASNFTLHRDLLMKESTNGMDVTVF